ncbi:hypothetical protein ABPG74_007253 [Tetrahymena malaccensis]
MSNNPEFKPLREQAKERNEKYEKIRERYEQRGPNNNSNNNQKKEDQKMQNNLYMLKDSFKGELYNEEDFDHFNYFNSLREKQQAIERQDLNDLEVQVKAKKISEPNNNNKEEENNLNIKRERSDSQNAITKQDSSSSQKKIKPNDSSQDDSKPPATQPIIVKKDSKEAPKQEVKNLAAVLGYSSSSDSE